jgi:hypothetical protein
MDEHLTEGSSALKPAAGQTLASPKLVSLAILKASWNDGRSYLDNFVPFVAECLRAEKGPVTASRLKVSMRERFGMRIPEKALETVMTRAAGQGLVTRRRGEYHPDFGKLASVTAPVHGDFLRCHAAVVLGLRTFAQECYSRDVSQAEASSALEAYVAEYGIPIVVQGAAAERDFDPAIVASPDLAYIVHAYVEYVAAADPSGFGYLATVVEGSMLASVVYLPDVGGVQRKFVSTTVYLDTPFVLRLLGYNGADLAAPALELIELLRDLGASVACFENTLNETRGVLLGAAKSLNSRRNYGAGNIIRSFRQQGLQRADVDLRAARLEKDLTRHGIRVLAAPPYTTTSDVDEVELERVLQEQVRYAHGRTLQHDLDALTAIDRLRRGRYQPILENCRALFLTTNPKLVRSAKRYFGSDRDGFSWPPAISDTELTTLVWLKQPMKAPDLPRKQIMADCYAALHPDSVTWDRWLSEIARAEATGDYSDEDLDLIRFSPDAQRILMDATFGDSDAVTPETFAEVVEKVKAVIARPIEDRLAEVEEQLEAEQRLRESAEAMALAEAKRADVATAAAEAVVRAEQASRRAVLQTTSRRRARLIGNAVFLVMLLVFVAGLGLSLGGVAAIPGPSLPGALRVLGVAVFLVSGGAGVASNGFGFNARHLGARIEERAQHRLLSRYLHRNGLEA